MNRVENNHLHENKAHFERQYQCNTYICSIPLDFTNIPVHWHNEVEIIVIKKGSGYVTLNFQKYIVSSGDIVIVLPGMLHSIEGNTVSSMEYENILFSKQFLQFSSNDITQKELLEPFFEGKLQIRNYLSPGHSLHSEVRSIIDVLDDKCDEKHYGYQLFVKGALIQIIYLLIANPPSNNENRQPDKYEDKLKSIIQYISAHYHEEITIDEISEFCHYSPSHFMKFFKAHTGMSFISYVNNFRVTEARAMLASTNDSILEISQKCGFTNLSNFNRMFKRKYGVSPRQIRN